MFESKPLEEYEISWHGPEIIYRFTGHPEMSLEVVEETLLILQEGQD